MQILDRLRSEINSLPPVVAWLAKGPETTRLAVISAKRKIILVQAPIALGSIAVFSAFQSLGIVEAKGHAQLFAHFCAATAFMWPPTLFSVCVAAKRDVAVSPHSIRNQLRILAFASGTIAAFATIVLVGVSVLYARTMLHM